MALALTGLLPLTGGCFGNFGLVRKVYDFNSTVSEDKTVREAVFLLLNFVPIYGGSALLDSIFFNTVEFFGGPKLITDSAHPGVAPESAVAEAAPHPVLPKPKPARR
jgi:hypothetical protein